MLCLLHVLDCEYLFNFVKSGDTILIFKTDLISVVTNGGGGKERHTDEYVRTD